ncbi:NET domain-containing protein [Balamuthia mandrillaris]
MSGSEEQKLKAKRKAEEEEEEEEEAEETVGRQAVASKELLYLSGEEESPFFIADGKDRVLPRPPQITKPPPSSVLSRVKSFLPQLQQANETLKQEMEIKPAAEFDIENVDESQPYIEMNLTIPEFKDDETNAEEREQDEDSENGEQPQRIRRMVVPIDEHENNTNIRH